MLGVDRNNKFTKCPKFCVAFDVEQGFIGLEPTSVSSINPSSKPNVFVGYQNAPTVSVVGTVLRLHIACENVKTFF